jgi:hypothetical protein
LVRSHTADHSVLEGLLDHVFWKRAFQPSTIHSYAP